MLRWLGDGLSPARCAACRALVPQRNAVFCTACLVSVERCPVSDRSIAFGYYAGALADAVRRFKYDDRPDLARSLGGLLRIVCRESRIAADIVVPVPLHARRLVDRGYNQSALLARHVADELGAPLSIGALVRVIDTAPQADLSREARRSNVAEAFRVGRSTLAGRAAVVVDDVSTTGATLMACSEALLAAGATRVTTVVVARTAPTGTAR